MNSWKQLKVPQICERLIGFSIPIDNEILIISYEGTHLLHIESEIKVENDESYSEYDIYNSEFGSANYRNKEYKIIGLHGGNAILDGLDGENLLLDTQSESLSIKKGNETTFSIKYNNFSGDWAQATFSADKRFIVLGCPYDFDFLIFERLYNVP